MLHTLVNTVHMTMLSTGHGALFRHTPLHILAADTLKATHLIDVCLFVGECIILPKAGKRIMIEHSSVIASLALFTGRRGLRKPSMQAMTRRQP